MLNVAVANRCCEILEYEPPYEALAALGAAFREGVEAAIAATGVAATVAQFGSVWGLHFTRREIRSYRDVAALGFGRGRAVQVAYRKFMLSRGFYIHPHTVIRGYLTTAHTRADVEGTVAATREFFELHAEELRAEPA